MGMIDGLPDLANAGSEFPSGHGFPAYGPIKRHSSPAANEDLERADALRRAASMGFRRVVLIDTAPRAGSSSKRLPSQELARES